MASLTSRSQCLTKNASASNIFNQATDSKHIEQMIDQDDQRCSSACQMIEKNIPRYMNPTIGHIKKHQDQIEEEVVQPNDLLRRDGTVGIPQTSKQSSLNRSKMEKSGLGSERKVWRPTGMRDDSLEQSYHVRVERHSPTKSFDMNMSGMNSGPNTSKLLRARSTATLSMPYDESAATTTRVPP